MTDKQEKMEYPGLTAIYREGARLGYMAGAAGKEPPDWMAPPVRAKFKPKAAKKEGGRITRPVVRDIAPHGPSAFFRGATELADYLGVHEMTVRRWARQGKLPKIAFHGVVLYRKSDIDAMVEAFKACGKRGKRVSA